jgi:hypothetical protein
LLYSENVDFVKRVSDLMFHPVAHSKILGLLTILLLASVVFVNVTVLQQQQTIKQRAAELPTPSPKTTSPTSIPTVNNLCSSFTANAGEISCADAVKIALEKYTGDIKSIKSEMASFTTGAPSNITTIKKAVWTVGINLKEPATRRNLKFNSLELYIIKDNRELRINSLATGKL